MGSFLIAAAALKTPTRSGDNAQGVNLNVYLLYYELTVAPASAEESSQTRSSLQPQAAPPPLRYHHCPLRHVLTPLRYSLRPQAVPPPFRYSHCLGPLQHCSPPLQRSHRLAPLRYCHIRAPLLYCQIPPPLRYCHSAAGSREVVDLKRARVARASSGERWAGPRYK